VADNELPEIDAINKAGWLTGDPNAH